PRRLPSLDREAARILLSAGPRKGRRRAKYQSAHCAGASIDRKNKDRPRRRGRQTCLASPGAKVRPQGAMLLEEFRTRSTFCVRKCSRRIVRQGEPTQRRRRTKATPDYRG